VIISQHDPETFTDLEGFFDVVLVDAPCSGEGLFRKDTAAMHEWSEENVKLCSLRQQRILSAAALLLNQGGHLIYSTCTYNSYENDLNVDWLKRTFDFSIIDLQVDATWNISKTKNGLQFFPHKNKGEGFYVATLVQNGKELNRLKGKIDLQRLHRPSVEAVKTWLHKDYADKLSFFQKKDGTVCAIPQSLVEDYAVVFKALFKRSSGLDLGIFKGSDFVPSHALAMSLFLSSEHSQIEVNKEQALKFLKKENVDIPTTDKGWIRVNYMNLGLGWIKNIGNRQNNYLPSELRIRMDIN
jgi:NOL1/NOP2/fmu family ribosome biogenesis protein